jgi:hypothetical protein
MSELGRLTEILKRNVFIAEVVLKLPDTSTLMLLIDRIGGSVVLVSVWRNKKLVARRYIQIDKVADYVEQLIKNLKPVEIKVRDLTRY